jgi:hypothetical protein
MALRQQRNLQGSDRPRLLAAAAKIMRRTLVDCARARRRQKRGGDKTREIMPPAIIDDSDTIDALSKNDANPLPPSWK